MAQGVADLLARLKASPAEGSEVVPLGGPGTSSGAGAAAAPAAPPRGRAAVAPALCSACGGAASASLPSPAAFGPQDARILKHLAGLQTEVNRCQAEADRCQAEAAAAIERLVAATDRQRRHTADVAAALQSSQPDAEPAPAGGA